MQTIEELREAAKNKLTGYTEKEIECFVQGAMYMAGNLPQKRSEEWYRQQAERKAENASKADAVCELFKEVTGLGAAVENLKSRQSVSDMTDRVLTTFFSGLENNPEYREKFLKAISAEDMGFSREIIRTIHDGFRAFNERHDIQLNFLPEEENEGRWTFSWDEPLVAQTDEK